MSGTGKEETDYIMPIILHRGYRRGDFTAKDVYLQNRCAVDFSNVRVTDESDNDMDFYIHSHGNYEVIPDTSRLGKNVTYIVNGKMVTSSVTNVTSGIAESSDNGSSWEILRTTGELVYISPSTGNYFAVADYKLYRSIDSEHKTWTAVIDMTDVSGIIIANAIKEDENGTLFVGRYQAANAALMWRSLDGGETFEVIYDATGDDTKQHIHSIGIDPVTGYVYGGVDGSGMKLIKSTNAGDREVSAQDITWSELLSSDSTDMLFDPDFRLFGSETTQNISGEIVSTVMRTEDDVSFVSELLGGKSNRGVFAVGNNIYMTTCAQYGQRYPQILQRQVDNTWKTIYMEKIDPGIGNDGWRYISKEGTPTGESENQAIVSVQGSYPPIRIFDGGDHYQALAYVKIPTLSASGGRLCIRHNNINNALLNESVFDNIVQTGLLVHYKLDEGTGTTISDSSGNGKHAVLVPGTGEWVAEAGRQSGNADPPIKKSGASFKFNGDGYIQITDSDIDEDFSFVKNFSVCLWIKSISTGGLSRIIGVGTPGNNQWGIALGLIYARFYYNSSDTMANPIYGATISDGSWKFIAFSIDDDSKITWCINGISQDPIQLDAISTPSGKLTIGADSSGGNNFTGSVDDIQIYDRALSGLEMQQLYENRFLAETEPNVINEI